MPQHLYDRATMARALMSPLEPRLHALLSQRMAALKTPKYDITDETEILIVQAGDIEDDIVRHVGFSPLIEPIDGHRFSTKGFYPWWDWLERHDGWFELIITFGSTFAYILFIEDSEGTEAELLSLCRWFA